MKLATRLRLLVGVSGLALVLVCGSTLRRHDSPLTLDVHPSDTHGEAVIPLAPERMTAISFTTASVGPFVTPEANEIVWYSGFGGELVTWFYEGSIGGRQGYVLDRWEVWPDKYLRFPSSTLIHLLQKGTHSLQTALMSDDVDRIVLGVPLNAPDSEVAARIARKEFRSIDHLFDWAAYAAT